MVIPVAPEPTSVSELQWALKQVHDHLVYRYGPLFGKIDRGLTSGMSCIMWLQTRRESSGRQLCPS